MIKRIIFGFVGLLTFILIVGSTGSSSDDKINNVNQLEKKDREVVEVLKDDTSTAKITNIPPTTPVTKTSTRQDVAENNKVGQQSPIISTKPNTSQNPKYTYYTVTDVVDGDTIKINLNGMITTLRLIGIDTPETVDPRKPVQCFGKEASNKAKELLSGRQVRIEADDTQDIKDKYDRLLVYVYRDDGLFYNQYMIEQGYAHEYTYQIPYKYQLEFKQAETDARNDQKGLWSPNTCNGDTMTIEATTNTPSSTPETSTVTNSSTSSDGKYYTSSHYSAKYYYPEACDGWKGLSSKYLKSFNSLEELLSTYSRTLNPQC